MFSFEWLQVCMCLFPFKYFPLTSTSYLGCRCSRYSYLLYFWGCVTSPMYNKLYTLCWSYFIVNQSLLLTVRVCLTSSHNCIGRKRSCTVLHCGGSGLSLHMPDDCKARAGHHCISSPRPFKLNVLTSETNILILLGFL